MSTPLRMLLAATLMLLGTAARSETVVAKEANCRAAARTSSLVLGALRRGEVVSVLSSEHGWSYVDPVRLPACWIRDDLLDGPAAYVDPVRPSSGSRAHAARTSLPEGVFSGYRFRSSSALRGTGSVRRRTRARGPHDGGAGCPCSGSRICVGPRGGRYCITSGGNKRYGV